MASNDVKRVAVCIARMTGLNVLQEPRCSLWPAQFPVYTSGISFCAGVWASLHTAMKNICATCIPARLERRSIGGHALGRAGAACGHGLDGGMGSWNGSVKTGHHPPTTSAPLPWTPKEPNGWPRGVTCRAVFSMNPTTPCSINMPLLPPIPRLTPYKHKFVGVKTNLEHSCFSWNRWQQRCILFCGKGDLLRRSSRYTRGRF